MVDIVTFKKASSQIQICSSNIDSLIMVYNCAPNMKKRGIFTNDAFIYKKVPQGSEKSALGTSCENQIWRRLDTMKNVTYVCF